MGAREWDPGTKLILILPYQYGDYFQVVVAFHIT
jgi:hypothetical protein